jgi:hypothetical protein
MRKKLVLLVLALAAEEQDDERHRPLSRWTWARATGVG